MTYKYPVLNSIYFGFHNPLSLNQYGLTYFVKCNNPKRGLNPVTNGPAVASIGQQMVANGTTSLQVTGERNDKAPAANSAPPSPDRSPGKLRRKPRIKHT